MRSRFASLVLTAAVLAVSPLQAQSVHFQFTDAGAGYNAFGVYIGTYGGTWDFMGTDPQHVGLNCVDFFHEVTTGEQWDANISSLGTGNVGLTRHAGSLNLYREAAWLISNYSSSNVQATQGTLWNLFQFPGANWPSDAALLAAAEAPHPGFDYSDWYVVTDLNAGGLNDASSVQEFIVYNPNESLHITSTPEPASLALLGTGLLGLVGLRLGRRKNEN